MSIFRSIFCTERVASTRTHRQAQQMCECQSETSHVFACKCNVFSKWYVYLANLDVCAWRAYELFSAISENGFNFTFDKSVYLKSTETLTVYSKEEKKIKIKLTERDLFPHFITSHYMWYSHLPTRVDQYRSLKRKSLVSVKMQQYIHEFPWITHTHTTHGVNP